MPAVGGIILRRGLITLESTSEPIHLAPASQPNSVHQLAERLFAAYTVDQGRVHLAGCVLEDCLFLRLSVQCGDDHREMFLDDQGQEVAGERIAALGMRQVVRLKQPPKDATSEIRRLTELGTHLARQRLAQGEPSAAVEVAAVWCKYAEGKLRFTVGENSVDLSFADWARTLSPPPYVCPLTGRSTFHLAAIDDGRIVPKDEIGCCAETGRRLLAQDLVTCSVTGRRVAAEFVRTCPISARPVLRSEMVKCRTCRQRVSPAVTERGQCSACRDMRSVTKADPRMARLLDEHPPLDRWGGWRIAETAKVYILTATGWLKQLLVVLDKESLEIRVLATATRFASGWRIVKPRQYEYVLRK